MAQRATGATPARRARTGRPCPRRGRSCMARRSLAKAAGTQRWNRLRRFERARDTSTTMRRHVPDQVTGKIIESPGGATGNEPLARRLAFSRNRRDSGVAVSVESVESPEDRSERKDYAKGRRSYRNICNLQPNAVNVPSARYVFDPIEPTPCRILTQSTAKCTHTSPRESI